MASTSRSCRHVAVATWKRDQIQAALRPDTFLVSVMQVNNETGVIQPLTEIAEVLSGHDAVFHTDAAQGFGKELDGLRSPRLDLISVSAHKIFGPKGVGALIARQNERTARLAPLCFGGGQERGLRPGTVPVPLVAGLGLAAELSATGSFRATRQVPRVPHGTAICAGSAATRFRRRSQTASCRTSSVSALATSTPRQS